MRTNIACTVIDYDYGKILNSNYKASDLERRALFEKKQKCTQLVFNWVIDRSTQNFPKNHKDEHRILTFPKKIVDHYTSNAKDSLH